MEFNAHSNYAAVGQRLRQARDKAGLTQGRFAEGLGVKTSIISEIERGNVKPSQVLLIAVEYVYGFRKEWILTGEEPMLREQSVLETPMFPAEFNINKHFRPWISKLIRILESGDKSKIEAVKAQLYAFDPIEIFTACADVFKCGGFAIGEKLPEGTGQLKGIQILDIEATPNMTIMAIVSRLIELYHQKPFRESAQRIRQLKNLLIASFGDNEYVTIIIRKAHNLEERTILNLKAIHEIHDGYGPSPQIVLLGDMRKLQKKVDALEDIRMRAFKI